MLLANQIAAFWNKLFLKNEEWINLFFSYWYKFGKYDYISNI